MTVEFSHRDRPYPAIASAYEPVARNPAVEPPDTQRSLTAAGHDHRSAFKLGQRQRADAVLTTPGLGDGRGTVQTPHAHRPVATAHNHWAALEVAHSDGQDPAIVAAPWLADREATVQPPHPDSPIKAA
jgi:hypothetical protein